jgi:sodium-dependent phosphate cotransporter
VVGGMTIAIVHLLFNVVGILILYPFPKFRYIPVTLAEKLASIAATRKPLAVVYVVGTFVVLPLLGILIFN